MYENLPCLGEPLGGCRMDGRCARCTATSLLRTVRMLSDKTFELGVQVGETVPVLREALKLAMKQEDLTLAHTISHQLKRLER